MNQMDRLKNFWESNRKVLMIVIVSVLSVCFVASIILAVFIGGEFMPDEESASVKGVLKITEEGFATNYIENDAFSFDTTNTKIQLLAKDPAKEDVVNIPELPAGSYGFKVNGEGEIIDDPSTITVTNEITLVSVVSKEYPTLSVDIPIRVFAPEVCSMRVVKKDYATTYFVGEPFNFDKQATQIMLYASETKDGESEEIELKELPSDDYGFKINGEGELIEDASSIVMSKNISTVEVVYEKYPEIKFGIDVRVLNEGELDVRNELLLEAESPDTNLYQDGNYISYEDRSQLPSPSNPFLSNAGDSPAGQDCSGGAVIRNLGKLDMKVEFVFESTQDCEVDLTILYCLRKDGKTFGEYYTVKINGENISGVMEQQTPVGDGYFTPASLDPVKIKVAKGTNTITFENNRNPANLDAIKLTASDAVLYEPLK